MGTIIADIETLRCTDEGQIKYLVDSVKPDSRLKDPAKVAADIEEKQKAVIEKSGLDGGFGMLALVGMLTQGIALRFANHEGTLQGERKMLGDFWEHVNSNLMQKSAPVIVGHNIKWDLRFIAQRSAVHGIFVNREFLGLNERYSNRIICTMEAWAGWGNTISLDRLCHALGVESPKRDIDGSQVHDLWMSGADGRDRVMDYNYYDLVATRECYERLRMVGMV